MLSIGEFAKIVGLTVKTVRLYQTKGLLMPVRVDPWTGYRYYDQSSIERARLIVQLRGFEFSLGEIRDILEHYHDEVNVLESLENQRQVIEEKLHRYSQIIESLDKRIQQGREILMATDLFQIDRDTDSRVEQWLARVKAEDTPEWSEAALSFTVSSEWGVSGGDALASVLGGQIGFDVWDSVLIADIASNERHRQAVLSALDDEQRRTVEKWLEAGLSGAVLEEGGLRLEEQRIAAAFALCGRAILMEVGANFLVPGDRALHIRLVPTHEEAIKHHAEHSKISVEAARDDMAKRGRAIESFTTETFDGDVHDPSAYDLVMNSASLNLFGAVELCVKAYESKFSPGPGWWYAT